MSEAWGMGTPDTGAFDASMLEYQRKLAEKLEAKLAKCCLHLLGVAQREAPLDEGTLRSSGSAIINGKAIATSDKRAGGKAGASAWGAALQESGVIDGPATSDDPGFSEPWGEVGFNTPYAATQDQRLDLHHPKGGRAGYLTDNLEKHKALYEKWLAEAPEEVS